MKRIKILLGYNDLELNKAIGMGDTLVVKDDRAEYLVSRGIAQIIEHIEEEAPVEDLSQPLKTPAGIRGKEKVEDKEILKGIFGEDKRDEEDKKLDERLVQEHEEQESTVSKSMAKRVAIQKAKKPSKKAVIK